MRFELPVRYAKILMSYIVGYPLYAPDSVSIIVTNKCNLRCTMCNFWKDNIKDPNGITLDEFKRLFADLRLLKVRTVQFTGGEPFLREDLITILKTAKANNLQTAVVTNGTLITKDNVLRFASNTDLVYVSLDAPSKNQYEDIRGIQNIFDKIIESVRLLVNTIKDNSLSSRVFLCATITSQGIHNPIEMVELVKKLGVNGVIYNPASSVYYGNTTLKTIYSENNIPKDPYYKMIDEIIRLMAVPNNKIRSNPFYLAASKHFISGKERYYKFPCFGGGYNGPLIGFDGMVFPCCAWNIPLGNIREEKFSEIWESARAKGIRVKIKKGQCPICYHHTRTFDFVWYAPILFRNPVVLLKGYKMISRI